MQNNRYRSRVRKAQQTRGRLILGLGCVLLGLALFFGLRALVVRDAANPAGSPAATLAPQAEPDAPDTEQIGAALKPDVQSGDEQPGAETKLLQIIRRKKGETKKVAITVDDCLSADVLRGIVNLAEKHGAGLTFFPKGNTIKKNAELWREIYEKGFEIENHTHTHTDVSKLKGDDLAKNIRQANDALNEALGVNYHMRLFRCPTGDGEKLPRLHQTLRELGYEGVASWGLSGTRKAEETIRLTQGGQVLLFHANKKSDLDALKKVIPGLIDRGFQLVTVNELYGKGPNLVTELDAGA